MTERYFNERKNLRGILLICDARREWTDEENIVEELSERRTIPFVCCLTKIDKLARAESLKLFNTWVKNFKIARGSIFSCFSVKKRWS